MRITRGNATSMKNWLWKLYQKPGLTQEQAQRAGKMLWVAIAYENGCFNEYERPRLP